jgi:taurine--2-oxoglutarate transaminase
MQTADLKALHKRRVLTPWSAQGALDLPVIVRAEGVKLYDDEGHGYIDASSGLVAVNLGHRHPRLVRAIAEQADRLTFSPPGWFNDQRALLAEKIIELAPWAEGGRVFFTPGGTEANEDAVRTARALTGRAKVLTAYRSFHGSSMGSATMTGENRRWASEPFSVPGTVRFFAPYPYRSPFSTNDPREEVVRAIAHLRDVINYENPDNIAAILVEPVVGSNGVIVYPEGYLAQVSALCNEYGILLIFDEVMTGFGRVGAAFAAERFGIEPDIMTFAKGVTSAYVPAGGFMLRESLARYFDDHIAWMGHTYSGHPLAMAAGVAALDTYRDEEIYARARGLEAPLRKKLETLAAKHEIVGDVRGVGAFFALEFTSDRTTHAPLVPWQGKNQAPMPVFFGGLRRRGVYAMGRYNVVHVAPPLTIKDEEIDEMVAAFDGAIGDLEAAIP